jgi:hypothetical protein
VFFFYVTRQGLKWNSRHLQRTHAHKQMDYAKARAKSMFSCTIGCLASVCAWMCRFCNLWSRLVQGIIGQVVPRLSGQVMCVSKNVKWIEYKKNKITPLPINSASAKCRKFRSSQKKLIYVTCGIRWLACCLCHAFTLLGLLFDPEDGSGMLLRNVC